MRRDPKGLYAGAGRGQIQQFTGYDAPFEPPERADFVVNTEQEPTEKSLDRLHAFVAPQVQLPSE